MGLYDSGSSGGLYGGRPARRQVSSPPAHHSLLGKAVHGVGSFTGHLLGDVRDATVGLPMGMVNIARHPIRSIEQIGETTWHDWSPLLTGHPGEFAKNFYAHPLAPILDVAAVFTGGAGLAAKGTNLVTRGEVAAAVSAGKDLSETSRLARLGRPHTVHLKGKGDKTGLTLEKHQAANPATRLRQQATRALGHELAGYMPRWFGRFSPEGEFARLEAKEMSLRGVATGNIKAAMQAQLGSIMFGGKKVVHDPAEVYAMSEPVMRDGLIRTARHANVAELRKANDKVLAPKGWRFVEASAPKSFKVTSPDELHKALESFGARHTTKDFSRAMHNEDGKVLLVRDRAVQEYSKEAGNSSRFLQQVYEKPTQVWKWIILATRPAFFVNNAVGNVMMTMFSLDPVSFSRGLVDSIRQVHGEDAAITGITKADRALRRALGNASDPIDQFYLGPHFSGFGQEAQQGLNLHVKLGEKGLPEKAVKVVKVGEQGLYPVTHKFAETFMRRILFNANLHNSTEVRALMRSGRSYRDAITEASKNPAFRSRMQEQVNNALGDYHHLSRVEQSIRKLIPFYTWDRAIMRHGVHLALDKPGRAAAGVALGESGTAATEKALGDIPSFMKGLIPLGGKSVLGTQGLNPYASIPDVTDTLGALVGAGHTRPGEAIATQINPLISGFIESATGQSMLSGAKLEPHGGGVLGQTGTNVVQALPQIKLLETLIHGEQKPKPNKRTGKRTPFLYRKDARTQIASLLGVPVKEVSKPRAHELANKEHGKKRRRRKRRTHGLYSG